MSSKSNEFFREKSTQFVEILTYNLFQWKNLESKCLSIIDNLTLKDLFKAAEDDLINFNIERCMGAAIVFTLTLT